MARALEELIDSTRSVCEDPTKFIENKLFDTLKALKPASETWFFLKDALVLQGAKAKQSTVKLGKDRFEVIAIHDKRGDLVKDYSFVELPEGETVTLADFEGLLKDGVFEFGCSESKPKTYFKNFLNEVKNARKQDVTREFKQDLDNSLLSMYVPFAAATGKKNFAKFVDLLQEHEPGLYDSLKAACNIKFNSPENIANALYDNLTEQARQILSEERKEHRKEISEIVNSPTYTKIANFTKNVVANGLIWTPLLAIIAGMAGLTATAPLAMADSKSPEKTSSRDLTQPTQIALPGDQDGPITAWGNSIVFQDKDYALKTYDLSTGDIQTLYASAVKTQGSKLIVDEHAGSNVYIKIYDSYTGDTVRIEDPFIDFTLNGNKIITVNELSFDNHSYIIKTYDIETGSLVSSDVINTAKECNIWMAGNHIVFTAKSPATYTLDSFYCYDITNKTLKTVPLGHQSQIMQSVHMGDNYFTFFRTDSYDVNNKIYSTPYFYTYDLNKNILKNTSLTRPIDYFTTVPGIHYNFNDKDQVMFYEFDYPAYSWPYTLVYSLSDATLTNTSKITFGSFFFRNYIGIVDGNFNFSLYNTLTKKEEFVTDNVCSVIPANGSSLLLSKFVNGQPDNGGLYTYDVTSKKLEQLVAPNPNIDVFLLSSFNKGRIYMLADVNKDPKISDYDLFYRDISPVWTSSELEKIRQYAPIIIHDDRKDTTATQTYMPANPHGDDKDVTNNHENYDKDPSKFSTGSKDPVYVKITEYPDQGFDVYTYIYYRAENPHWIGLEAFKHEHDVQRVHVKVDRATGNAIEVAYSQHDWMAKQQVKDSSDLTFYSEWGGHEYWKFSWLGADGKGQKLSSTNTEFRPLDEVVSSLDADKDGKYKTNENNLPTSPPPKVPWLYSDVKDPQTAFGTSDVKGVFMADLHSPGDLSVIINNAITDKNQANIPNSVWQNDSVGILGTSVTDKVTLKVVGTVSGSYSLLGVLAADKPYVINGIDVPIKKDEVHTYTVLNWGDLADGKATINWTIQKDGKAYSRIVRASEITKTNYDEITKEPQNPHHPTNGNNTTQPADNTVIYAGSAAGATGLGIGLGAYALSRRRKQQPPMQTSQPQVYSPQELQQTQPSQDLYANDYAVREQQPCQQESWQPAQEPETPAVEAKPIQKSDNLDDILNQLKEN